MAPGRVVHSHVTTERERATNRQTDGQTETDGFRGVRRRHSLRVVHGRTVTNDAGEQQRFRRRLARVRHVSRLVYSILARGRLIEQRLRRQETPCRRTLVTNAQAYITHMTFAFLDANSLS